MNTHIDATRVTAIMQRWYQDDCVLKMILVIQSGLPGLALRLVLCLLAIDAGLMS